MIQPPSVLDLGAPKWRQKRPINKGFPQIHGAQTLVNTASAYREFLHQKQGNPEHGVFVDHSDSRLEEAFRKRKRKRGIGAAGKSWRLDETYIKISGTIVTGIVPWINKATRSTSC